MFQHDVPSPVADLTERAAIFEPYRSRLSRVAYRLLGSLDDTEDVVQETALRWIRVDTATIRSPEGWLVATVTRLSIDWLRRAATGRRVYESAGAPEPMATSEWAGPHAALDQTSDLARGFRVLLERLGPVDRIAFVLRDVFDVDYEGIAHLLQKSEAACRQLLHRARARVRQGRGQLAAAPPATQRLVDRCLGALASGDREALLGVLANDGTRISQIQVGDMTTVADLQTNQDVGANLQDRVQVAAA